MSHKSGHIIIDALKAPAKAKLKYWHVAVLGCIAGALGVLVL